MTTKTKTWSQLTFLTILLSPVICIYVRDLDDGPIGTKATIKTRIVEDKLRDDIDDQMDADLMPPNFQPDPLLPLSIGSDDDFEDVGRLNKGRIVDDPEDPFNRYMDNIFDSLPESPNIFDVLRSKKPSNSPDRDHSPIPPELLIPLLMHRDLSIDGDDQDSRESELQEATLKMAKLILDSKQFSNKTDKSTGKDHERKLIGKLNPLKISSTPLTSKETSIGTTTDKPDESKEGITIDEKADQIHGEEDEEKSKSTTKPSKFRHLGNPLFKWFSKSKSTTPKGDHKSQGKTTTDVGRVATTEGPKSLEVDNDDDDDIDSTSSNSTTTIAPSTMSTTNRGASTTIKPNKSTTILSTTTDHSTKSDSGELTSTSKGKHPKSTKSPKTSKKEDDGDTDKAETTEDSIDILFSSLNVDASTDKMNSSTTKSEAKHSHKHNRTTTTTTTPVPTETTPIDNDKSTAIGSDLKSSKKWTTKEAETATTIKSTTSQLNNEDIFPTVSVTKSKTKSEAPTKTTTTTTPPSLTAQGHKTTRHPSTAKSPSGSTTTTTIPTLRPYSEDLDDLFLPEWNPDIFP